MLEMMEQVDWKAIKQANGAATSVPSALRDLISGDAKVRESAYWTLDNHVVLQSDLYEAAYYVLPFLIEILRSGTIAGREYVYDLLTEIANGYAPESEKCLYKGEEVPLAEGCKAVVADEIDLFVQEVENTDSDFRNNALELLIVLRERKIIPTLKQLFADERNPEFAALLETAILELSEG